MTEQASPEVSWTERREMEAQAAVKQQPPDYRRYHQAHAAGLGCLVGKSVLVVGCNRGKDCEYFVDLGALSVVGLDVLDDVGQDFTHQAVTYVRESAEDMRLKAGSFDLVFAYATLEHVPDIIRAFHEMARVVAPGGFIYSAAAPLWCTRSGPHWGDAFNHEPWPHLRMNVEEVVDLGQQAQQAGSTNPYHSASIIHQHLTQPLLFNRRRAHEYVDACLSIEGMQIIRNDIEFEAPPAIEPTVAEVLFVKGYTAFDLLGLTHMFIATKPGIPGMESSPNHSTSHPAGFVGQTENPTPGDLLRRAEAAESEAEAMRQERDAAMNEAIALSRRAEEAEAEAMTLCQARDAARDESDAFRASTSWRMTSPLRRIAGLFKRGSISKSR